MTGPGIVWRRIAVAATLVLVAGACGDSGGSFGDLAATSSSSTSIAAATSSSTTSTTTSTSTTTTTLAPTTTSTSTTTTTLAPTTTLDAVATCQVYGSAFADILTRTAGRLSEGAELIGAWAAGTQSAADVADQLTLLTETFAGLLDEVDELGVPVPQFDAAAAGSRLALIRFRDATDAWARGVRGDDAGLIDEGVVLLGEGEDFMLQVADQILPCAEAGSTTATTEPDAQAVEIWLRTAESVLAAGPYADSDPDDLVAGALAACAAIRDGEELRDVVLTAVATIPGASEEFGSGDQALAILLVVRGALVYCPDLVADEDLFGDDVVAAIVDIIVEQ